MRNYKMYILSAAAILCLAGCKTGTKTSDSTVASAEEISTEIQSDTYTEVEVETETEAETETETETEPEAETETAPETETEAETSANTETEATETTCLSETEAESETETIVYSSCDSIMYLSVKANIRLAPSLEAGIYDVYPAGTPLQCIATSPEWTIVSIDFGTYYVSTPLLSSESPLETAPESSTEETVGVSTGEGIAGQNTENGILYSIGAGPLVCIDAGHQGHGNSDTEPNGPGSTTYKAKVTTGTSGCVSGLTEAQLNLTVSCQLRDELLARGYNVLMIRESQEVDISNAQRAQMANAAGADILVRIHANGSDDPSVSGALTMSPTAANPYIASLYPACRSLSENVVNALCSATGAVNRGVYETDTMTGINWCAIPVTIVEMGYMTNPTEDTLMASPDYQAKIITGIANGIDSYFGR